MKKINLLTIGTGIMTFISSLWYMLDLPVPDILSEVLLYIMGISICSFICLCGLQITKLYFNKKQKTFNGYIAFAIIDVILMILLAAYGFYDMSISTGWMKGIMGVIIYIYVMPIPVGLLIIDGILYFYNHKKGKNQ